MTVVVGFNWLSEMVMIADTRVSWPHGTLPPQDNLIKLYTFRDHQGKAAVLGFSGKICAAKAVLVYLKQRVFPNYGRPFIMATLKDNLQGWIERVVTTKLTPEARAELKFVLCGAEPSRHPPVARNGKVVGFLSVPELHLYRYVIAKNSGRVMVSRNCGFAIIGSGQQLEKEIHQKVNQTIRFGFASPQLHWARAALISDVIALMFRDRPSDKVGGPFQTIRVTANGISEHYTWPPVGGSANVQVQRVGGRLTIRNRESGETYDLYPIWNLPP